MVRRAVPLLLSMLVMLSLAPGSAPATPGPLVLVSTDASGVKGNAESINPAMPEDGSMVAFRTHATNFDPRDTDTLWDEYVKDLSTGQLTLISVSNVGVKQNGDAFNPVFAADGSKVAFRSGATNLDPADTDETMDIYVRDLGSGQLVLASTSSTGVKGNGGSYNPYLDEHGDKLAFRSYSSNLDPNDPDHIIDVYVKNLSTGELVLASTSSAGVKGNANSGNPAMSYDGSKVAFYTAASNLDPTDTDARSDVYLKNLATGQLTLLSRTAGGIKGNGDSLLPSISADGSMVAFTSGATNFVPADTDPQQDVYVKNVDTGELQLVSSSSTGVKGNGRSYQPTITPDGTQVAFVSESSNLDPADTDTTPDLYLKNLVTGQLTLLSTTADGSTKANGEMQNPAFNGAGTRVAIFSAATNLVPGDADPFFDVYVKELGSDRSVNVSASPDPATAGQPLTYTIGVANGGPVTSTNVTLQNTLQGKAQFVSAEASQGTCQRSGRDVTCDLGTILGGHAATVTIVVLPRRGGTLTDTAAVSGDQSDYVAGNDSATLTTRVRRT